LVNSSENIHCRYRLYPAFRISQFPKLIPLGFKLYHYPTEAELADGINPA
jgi:hypothetical protein